MLAAPSPITQLPGLPIFRHQQSGPHLPPSSSCRWRSPIRSRAPSGRRSANAVTSMFMPLTLILYAYLFVWLVWCAGHPGCGRAGDPLLLYVPLLRRRAAGPSTSATRGRSSPSRRWRRWRQRRRLSPPYRAARRSCRRPQHHRRQPRHVGCGQPRRVGLHTDPIMPFAYGMAVACCGQLGISPCCSAALRTMSTTMQAVRRRGACWRASAARGNTNTHHHHGWGENADGTPAPADVEQVVVQQSVTSELAHGTAESCWLAICGKVYGDDLKTPPAAQDAPVRRRRRRRLRRRRSAAAKEMLAKYYVGSATAPRWERAARRRARGGWLVEAVATLARKGRRRPMRSRSRSRCRPPRARRPSGGSHVVQVADGTDVSTAADGGSSPRGRLRTPTPSPASEVTLVVKGRRHRRVAAAGRLSRWLTGLEVGSTARLVAPSVAPCRLPAEGRQDGRPLYSVSRGPRYRSPQLCGGTGTTALCQAVKGLHRRLARQLPSDRKPSRALLEAEIGATAAAAPKVVVVRTTPTRRRRGAGAGASTRQVDAEMMADHLPPPAADTAIVICGPPPMEPPSPPLVKGGHNNVAALVRDRPRHDHRAAGRRGRGGRRVVSREGASDRGPHDVAVPDLLPLVMGARLPLRRDGLGLRPHCKGHLRVPPRQPDVRLPARLRRALRRRRRAWLQLPIRPREPDDGVVRAAVAVLLVPPAPHIWIVWRGDPQQVLEPVALVRWRSSSSTSRRSSSSSSRRIRRTTGCRPTSLAAGTARWRGCHGGTRHPDARTFGFSSRIQCLAGDSFMRKWHGCRPQRLRYHPSRRRGTNRHSNDALLPAVDADLRMRTAMFWTLALELRPPRRLASPSRSNGVMAAVHSCLLILIMHECASGLLQL